MRPAFGRGKDAFFTEQGFQIRGTVHVGVNDGQELGWYLQQGQVPILGFEPNPEVFDRTAVDFAPEIADGRICLVNAALGDRTGEMPLHMLLNLDGVTYDTMGASTFRPSSAYPPDGWLPAKEGKTITVSVVRFDEWVKLAAVDLASFDLLVVDVQGMELEALKGFGDYLDAFRYLMVECSETPIYDGEAPAQEVCDYLASKGFVRFSPILSHNDIMFLRAA